ncbi:MAG TPA: hypothetical protein VFU50_11485 [Terriglobales bacterium]|nr:hypothetical protein [Terriglobales bacterium]
MSDEIAAGELSQSGGGAACWAIAAKPFLLLSPLGERVDHGMYVTSYSIPTYVTQQSGRADWEADIMQQPGQNAMMGIRITAQFGIQGFALVGQLSR